MSAPASTELHHRSALTAHCYRFRRAGHITFMGLVQPGIASSQHLFWNNVLDKDPLVINNGIVAEGSEHLRCLRYVWSAVVRRVYIEVLNASM